MRYTLLLPLVLLIVIIGPARAQSDASSKPVETSLPPLDEYSVLMQEFMKQRAALAEVVRTGKAEIAAAETLPERSAAQAKFAREQARVQQALNEAARRFGEADKARRSKSPASPSGPVTTPGRG